MATFTPNYPPSSFLRVKGAKDGDGPKRQTKEEYRKMKELEEGRKAGTVPAMTDIETGKDINPHIPHYIANAPWYVGSDGPTLKHQRPHPDRQVDLAEITDTYKRGLSTKLATKYRKGACENCGSMTHKKKDCFERPRKIGAQFTGEDIAPDEYVPGDLEQTYDAKRDRWNGFNPADHQVVVEEYRRLEEARKIIKSDQLSSASAPTPVGDANSEADAVQDSNANADVEKVVDEDKEVEQADDEDKYAEGADMPGVKLDVDSRTRITVRNLRIREDTAKYLYNLDPESAYYDPKSRAMRDNPFKSTGKGQDEVPFAGDNFKRFSGEVVDANQIQLFAWDAHNRGVDVHVLAEPTKLEALKNEFRSRKLGFKNSLQQTVLDKYGGEEHFDAPPKELLLAQTESYVEYNRKGRIVKGVERSATKSKYEEDVFPNNHTSVWGSYWKLGHWGYACCHGFVKNSYCTGEDGKLAQQESTQFADAKLFEKKKDEPDSNSDSDSSSSESSSSSSESEEKKQKQKRLDEERRSKRAERKRKRRVKQKVSSRTKRQRTSRDETSTKSRRNEDESDSSNTDNDGDNEDKEETPELFKQSKRDKTSHMLRKALVERVRLDREGEMLSKMDDRDRPYHSNYDTKKLNDYELEAYNLTKIHTDDPMASYLSKK